METENKKEVKTEGIKKSNTGIIIGIIALVVIAIIGIAFAVTSKSDKVPDNPDIASVTIKDAEKEKLLESVGKAIENVNNANTFMIAQDGEDTYKIFVYNKYGEGFGQASDGSSLTVYRKDHKAINYSEYISFGNDTEIRSLITSAYELAADGTFPVMTTTKEYQAEGHSSIVVDVQGFENIKKLYSNIGDDFADSVVEQMKLLRDKVVEDGTYGITADDQVNFRFIIVSNDEESWIESVGCYIYFGDKKPETLEYSDLSLNWVVEGINELYDWELLDGWYTFDWSTLTIWEDLTPAEDLLEEQFSVIQTMIEKFSEDNGIDLSGESEGTDIVENETDDIEDNTLTN